MKTTRLVLLGIWCVACAACNPPAPQQGAASASVAPPAPSAAEPSREQVEEQARVLLGRWLAAQNQRKLDAYRALYAPDFSGIRRTPSGEEKKLDLAAWEADRRRLFEKPQMVAADEVKITVLPAGEVEVTFIQRWKSPSAADHGPKELRLRRGADGQYRIVREDLRSSTKGWGEDNVVEVDGTSLKSPVTVSAIWKKKTDGPVVTTSLVLVAKDAAGASKEWNVPASACTSDYAADPSARLGKKREGGIVLEGAHTCGLEYRDVFRVVADAAGVVVKDRTIIELHAENAATEDTGWTDLLRVNLAKGAEVSGE